MSDHDLKGVLNDVAENYKNKLKVIHINAESLLVNAHSSEFVHIFDNSKLDIIAVSETWYNDSDDFIPLNGYNLFAANRTSHQGGGVAVYVRECYSTRVLFHSTSPAVRSNRPDYIILEIATDSYKMLFACIYRPPKAGHLEDFENDLSNSILDYNYTIVAGDVNAHFRSPKYFDVTDRKPIANMLDLCSLSLVEYGSTFHLRNCDSWLDMIATNFNDKLVHFDKFPNGLSYHDLLLAVFSFNTPKYQPRTWTFRDLKNCNIDELREDAQNANWEDLLALPCIDDKVKRFNEIVLALYDKHAPYKTRTACTRPKPWMTKEILKLINLRDEAYLLYSKNKCKRLHDVFKSCRNDAKQAMRNAKIRYAHKLFSESKSSRDMWSNLKKLKVVKPAQPVNNGPSPDTLNRHFVNVVTTDLGLVEENIRHFNNLEHSARDKFHFEYVTPETVMKTVLSIGSNAKGIDDIPVSFFKLCLFEFTPAMMHICNFSLQHGCFPDMWKCALVKPLAKVPVPRTAKDLRPISLLCVGSKILEKIVYEQITKYLELHGILNPLQSGFKKGHSTSTALLKVSHDIRKAMDSKKLSLLILYDFSNAFPSVHHELLLAKLSNMGFSKSAVQWLRSYLQGRSQVVSLNGVLSEILALSYGVPQGSILGPLLYSLYVNDIGDIFLGSKFHLYADDLQLLVSCSPENMHDTIRLINDEATALCLYSERHNLRINPVKTQAIIIGNPKLIKKLVVPLPAVTVNNVEIPLSMEVKNLGVIFDGSLNWEAQIIAMCKKCMGSLYRLRRQKDMLPTVIRTKLVISLVFPTLDYACTVFNDMSAQSKLRVQRVQNACIRFIYDLKKYCTITKKYCRITPYLIQTNWLNLENRRIFSVLVLLFKIIVSRSPPYLWELLVFTENVQSRLNRHSRLTLRVPQHRTNKMKGAFSVLAPTLWNAVPLNIRSSTSVPIFKAKLLKHLLEKQNHCT